MLRLDLAEDHEPRTGDDNRREVARGMTCAGAALALIVVPVYHLIDILDGAIPDDLLWLHAAWRIPVTLVALVALACCTLAPRSQHSALVLRVLSAGVMIMMFGLFGTDLLHPDGDPERMARGIIMATFAVSLLSLRGGREVLLLFGLPLVLCLGWLWWVGAGWLEAVTYLVDPMMMLVIAMIASELLYRIRSDQFILQRELRQLASIDALTGLHNRRELERRIAREMSRSRRHDTPLSVVIGDLDLFKQVNDRYGHAVGDDVLRSVGERMRENLRAEDLAVRWGGEEFLLMLPDTDLEEAVRVADKIRKAVAERPVAGEECKVAVTISFGVARFDGHESLGELVRRADDAMYRAKSEGRNRVCA
jgi:diguanylate cyclase (GGDEF)-like protein